MIAILAQSRDGIIGVEGCSGGELPWKLPADLKRFKELTTGHAVIMGRKTFDSIGRRGLPKRTNIVLTRRPHEITAGDVAVFSTVEGAVEYAFVHDRTPYVIGGAQIYEALWSQIDRVELTYVDTLVGLGTVFEWDVSRFREVSRSQRWEHAGLGYEFVTYERRPS